MKGEDKVHTHFSITGALTAFLGVIVIGTLWRLIGAHFVQSDRPALVHIGQVMAFQY